MNDQKYSEDVGAALEAGRKLREPLPQREITVSITIADRGALTTDRFTADLDDRNAMAKLSMDVDQVIKRSTGG